MRRPASATTRQAPRAANESAYRLHSLAAATRSSPAGAGASGGDPADVAAQAAVHAAFARVRRRHAERPRSAVISRRSTAYAEGLDADPDHAEGPGAGHADSSRVGTAGTPRADLPARPAMDHPGDHRHDAATSEFLAFVAEQEYGEYACAGGPFLASTFAASGHEESARAAADLELDAFLRHRAAADEALREQLRAAHSRTRIRSARREREQARLRRLEGGWDGAFAQSVADNAQILSRPAEGLLAQGARAHPPGHCYCV